MFRSASRARKASDADRQAALEVIRRAYVAGSIDVEDLRSRTAVALLSGTIRELADLTQDLGVTTGTPGSAAPWHLPTRLRYDALAWPAG